MSVANNALAPVKPGPPGTWAMRFREAIAVRCGSTNSPPPNPYDMPTQKKLMTSTLEVLEAEIRCGNVRETECDMAGSATVQRISEEIERLAVSGRLSKEDLSKFAEKNMDMFVPLLALEECSYNAQGLCMFGEVERMGVALERLLERAEKGEIRLAGTTERERAECEERAARKMGNDEDDQDDDDDDDDGSTVRELSLEPVEEKET